MYRIIGLGAFSSGWDSSFFGSDDVRGGDLSAGASFFYLCKNNIYKIRGLKDTAGYRRKISTRSFLGRAQGERLSISSSGSSATFFGSDLRHRVLIRCQVGVIESSVELLVHHFYHKANWLIIWTRDTTFRETLHEIFVTGEG